jgi:hypothetical protein
MAHFSVGNAPVPSRVNLVGEQAGQMMDPLLLAIFVFALGFGVGYGVREMISRKRHRRRYLG